MKMFKRFAAALLAGVMVLAMLTACCTAVQRFRFRAAHKFGLPRLGPPDHRHSCLYNAHGSSSTVGSSTTPHSAPSACAP